MSHRLVRAQMVARLAYTLCVLLQLVSLHFEVQHGTVMARDLRFRWGLVRRFRMKPTHRWGRTLNVWFRKIDFDLFPLFVRRKRRNVACAQLTSKRDGNLGTFLE